MNIHPADLMNVPFAGKTGYCMSGCRVWAARHGIDWAAFVRDGIPAERLIETGDALALAAVEWKARQTDEYALPTNPKPPEPMLNVCDVANESVPVSSPNPSEP